MGRRADDPLVQWIENNKPNATVDREIDRWLDAAVAAEGALAVEEAIDDWMLNRSGSPPDFVACVAWYGRSRLLTQGWKKLPVEVPEYDLERWRAAGYKPTIEEFWDRQAGAAGGFLELAGRDPGVICAIMQKQLDAKMAKLEDLANLPLSEFTPEELTDDDIQEGADSAEQNYFDRPFVLREELECFAWALQKYRSLCLSHEYPALGLPNRQLFEEMGQIDINALTSRLAAVDPKLRRILEHLAGFNYFSLDNEVEPDQFWWRHWQSRGHRGT